MNLSQMNCYEERLSLTKLSDQEIDQYMANIKSHWKKENNSLKAQFNFSDFNHAYAMATQIALLSEKEWHHPVLSVTWGKLTVEYSTHDVDGLSKLDFILAAKIDQISKDQ